MLVLIVRHPIWTVGVTLLTGAGLSALSTAIVLWLLADDQP